jgi:outer membrane protein assembly factor BamA
MVLFNAEYWVDADAHWRGQAPMDDMGLGVFFDMGSAWWANDPRNPFDQLDALVGQGGVGEEMELVKTLGFAVALEDIRLDLARPLDGEEDTWEFSLRFGRAF